MADQVPVEVVQVSRWAFWLTTEGRKDAVTILGCVMELVNLFSPHLPPVVCAATGIIIGRLINLFGNPSSTKMLVKTLTMLLFAMLLSGQAMAWDFPSSTLGIVEGDKLSLSPSSGGQDAFILAPITNIGFDVANLGNFGLGFSYAILFANLTETDANNVSVNPYFGFGPYFSANLGSWVAAQGNAVISAEMGLILIGPKIQGFPEVGLELGFRTDTGAQVLKVNADFPLLIFPDATIHRLN